MVRRPISGWTAALAGVSALLVLPTAAGAMIPPSYKILVVAPDAETEAVSRALVEAMSSLGAFFRQSPDLSRHEVRGCLTEADLAACIHDKVSKIPVDPRARPVVIVARPRDAGQVSWTCLGSGANSSAPAAVPTDIDLRAALFGEATARSAERRKAMTCIYAAEVESLAN
jgi:hypothetical protein